MFLSFCPVSWDSISKSLAPQKITSHRPEAKLWKKSSWRLMRRKIDLLRIRTFPCLRFREGEKRKMTQKEMTNSVNSGRRGVLAKSDPIHAAVVKLIVVEENYGSGNVRLVDIPRMTPPDFLVARTLPFSLIVRDHTLVRCENLFNKPTSPQNSDWTSLFGQCCQDTFVFFSMVTQTEIRPCVVLNKYCAERWFHKNKMAMAFVTNRPLWVKDWTQLQNVEQNM